MPRKNLGSLYLVLMQIRIRIAQSRFQRFQSGHFDIKGVAHAGRRYTDEIDPISKKKKWSRIGILLDTT